MQRYEASNSCKRRATKAVYASPQKLKDRAIEWTLGLGVPLLVAGPFCKLTKAIPRELFKLSSHEGYIVAPTRFAVVESVGCIDLTVNSVLTVLLLQTGYVIPPLICVTVYYRAFSTIHVFA